MNFCKSSERKHYITIKYAVIEKDSIGTPVAKYYDRSSVWASIRPIQARERKKHLTTDVVVTHLVGVDGYTEVEETDIISWDSREFKINTIENIEESDFEKVLTCTEIIP